MYKMMFYNLAIRFLHWGFLALSRMHPKAGERMRGLKKNAIPKKHKKRIWFHCASAGEYEQARPIIRQMQSMMDVEILTSFFSSSGMEHAQRFPEGDFFCYLPFDHPKDATEFVHLVDAEVVIWVKYEFWINILKAIEKRNTPLYLINADLQQLDLKTGIYGSIVRKCLPVFSQIYAVSAGFGHLTNIRLAADSKWQQAKENSWQDADLSEFDAFIDGTEIVVCGSVHADDLKMLGPSLSDESLAFRWIIVPHETDDRSISKMLSYLPKGSFSILSKGIHAGSKIVLVDKKGILKFLYRYATVAYVGGGFGKSVHNVLEPAAYGVPVFSGPHLEGIPEARLLRNLGVLFPAQSSSELGRTLQALSVKDFSHIRAKSSALFDEQIRNGFIYVLAEKIAQELSQA
jgi:3-deoxy-D-manno-octulosonic-acid transferase